MTPEWLQQRIRDYYDATIDTSYLPHWSGDTMCFHLGLADDRTPSRAKALENTNERVAVEGRVTAASAVLDAGCGIGGSAIHLARTRGARVTGVTLCSRQVERARRNAEAHGVAALAAFVCADFAATGLPPGTFDLVYNVESYCYAHDARAYVRHVYDLLKPGGRFVCIDFFRGDRGDPEHWKQMSEGWVLPALGSAGELVQALDDAGFGPVYARDLLDEVRRPAQALRVAAQRSELQWRIERSFGIAPPPAPLYEAHVRAGLAMADGFDSGAVTYDIVVGTKPVAS